MTSVPGAAAFFNRPRPNQLDPNGNSIFTNYGFQDEVATKVCQFKFFNRGPSAIAKSLRLTIEGFGMG
jgi:hypothetical protein